MIFKSLKKPKELVKKEEALALKIPIILVDGNQKVLNVFVSGMFPKRKQTQEKGRLSILAGVAKVSDGNQLLIFTPKQMLKTLPIAPAQVKAGKPSESLLNKIRQIMYSFYRAKEIILKVYNNIMNNFIKTEWMLYLKLLQIVKHPTLISYYSIFQII